MSWQWDKCKCCGEIRIKIEGFDNIKNPLENFSDKELFNELHKRTVKYLKENSTDGH